MVTFIQS